MTIFLFFTVVFAIIQMIAGFVWLSEAYTEYRYYARRAKPNTAPNPKYYNPVRWAAITILTAPFAIVVLAVGVLFGLWWLIATAVGVPLNPFRTPESKAPYVKHTTRTKFNPLHGLFNSNKNPEE